MPESSYEMSELEEARPIETPDEDSGEVTISEIEYVDENGDAIEVEIDEEGEPVRVVEDAPGGSEGENADSTSSGYVSDSDSGAGDSGDDTEGKEDTGETDTAGNTSADTGGTGDTVNSTYNLILKDKDGNQIGEIPILVDEGSVTMEVGAVSQSEWQESMLDNVNFISSVNVVLLIALFACFGALVISTVVRSFEWK